MENILYVLNGNRWENKTVKSERFNIDFLIIPLEEIPDAILGSRYHKIYCDASFTQKRKGQDFINYIIKPMASLGDGEFYLI